MSTVPASKLRPFVAYLEDVYDDLEEVSEISGIEYELLHDISAGDADVDATNAQRIVDFLLAHRRITSDVFYSFEDKDTKPRFPNPTIAAMRSKEIRMLKREKKKKGY